MKESNWKSLPIERETEREREKNMLDLWILSQKIISDCIIAGEKVDFWFNRFIYKNDPLN